MKLLIAEGEPDLVEALTVFFEKNQFTVDAVHDGQDACNYASGGGYDAVILDAMMPKMDGIEVLRRLRSDGFSAPVLLLTAKGEKDSRVPGFDAGADDCLPKPFAPDELLSHVRALLRCAGDHESAVLTFCGLSLDCAAGTLCCGRETACLSGCELRVMELFMRSPRTLFSAERIKEQVWGWDSGAEISAVWVHISNLRKKLKAVGSAVSIHAIRGRGYLIESAEDHI